jgi:hypothetical protein
VSSRTCIQVSARNHPRRGGTRVEGEDQLLEFGRRGKPPVTQRGSRTKPGGGEPGGRPGVAAGNGVARVERVTPDPGSCHVGPSRPGPSSLRSSPIVSSGSLLLRQFLSKQPPCQRAIPSHGLFRRAISIRKLNQYHRFPARRGRTVAPVPEGAGFVAADEGGDHFGKPSGAQALESLDQEACAHAPSG